jgi:hypothetical protein
MASFSVMIGRRTTTARNHNERPRIQSKVDVIDNLRTVGGLGRGFALAFFF